MCGTAAGTGNLISSLLTLEGEESRARGTDGYIRCSGTFLSSLASIELETGEIYCKDSVVATCGTAVGTGNFVSSLLILEASESRARGTDGYIRCGGTFLSSLASIELETGEIYHEDSVVVTCGTAAGMGNFISSLLTLEAEESRARGTDGYIRCSGTFLSSLASIELETGEIYCEDSVVVTCGTAAGMGNFISLLLILEASESRVQGTGGCIRCSGTPSLACPCHCPHLHGSGDGGHRSVCGPGLGPGTNAGAEATVMGR